MVILVPLKKNIYEDLMGFCLLMFFPLSVYSESSTASALVA